MPSTSTPIASLRPDLGEFTEFDAQANANGFIGLQVFPPVDVALAAGPFGRIPIEEILRADIDVRRAPNSSYNTIDWKFTDDSYATKDYGIVMPIDRRNAKAYGNVLRVEMNTARIAAGVLGMEAEKRIGSAVFNPTTFAAHTAAATASFANKASATPVADVRAARLAVWAACGLWANAAIMNVHTFLDCIATDEVKEEIQSQGAGDRTLAKDITAAKLAEVFNVSRVIVAGATTNTAAYGQAFAGGSPWGSIVAGSRSIMVARLAETDMMEEPCLGRVFHWGEDGSQIGGTVETWYDEDIRGDKLRVRHDVYEKLFDARFGYLLTGC